MGDGGPVLGERVEHRGQSERDEPGQSPGQDESGAERSEAYPPMVADGAGVERDQGGDGGEHHRRHHQRPHEDEPSQAEAHRARLGTHPHVGRPHQCAHPRDGTHSEGDRGGRRQRSPARLADRDRHAIRRPRRTAR